MHACEGEGYPTRNLLGGIRIEQAVIPTNLPLIATFRLRGRKPFSSPMRIGFRPGRLLTVSV
jgi:hypothetical protein